MKSLIPLLFVLTTVVCFGQTKKELAIIPEPVSTSVMQGEFTLAQTVNIEASSKETEAAVNALSHRLTTATGCKVNVTASAANAQVKLILNKNIDSKLKKEGYSLSVTPKAVTIKANDAAGLFYGVQTLLQLFPKEIESNEVIKNTQWKIPCVEIIDYPRFEWRGLMLDVTRHFFTKEEVKKFIDDMVRYKYNILHLHLSDDEGWRVEIKGLPRLTEVGAWRVKKEGYFGTFSPPAPDEPRTYGGFYTQDDIKEIVRYAKEKFVNILPEIDVPGHSLAAVVSYPELSCTPEANTYVVRSGEPIMDWSHGAPPIALVDNTLCPANEKVYSFLDRVFTQLAELFPFGYIHVGGDEVPQNFWQKNAQITSLAKREGLKDMHAVQGYFMRKVEQIVNSKGKKMIGWDEITEAGVAPSAAIMSWRGTKFGIEAANKGHDVVMSPSTFAYLDYMQGDSIVEPRVYATLRLSTAYQFDPAPEGVDASHIKGGQANLWSEQLYNVRHLEYMLWPRGLAIAESVWSPKERKNWNNFFSKVEQHFQRFDVADIKYARSAYDPIWDVSRDANKQLKIKLTTEVEGLDIYYSFDNTFPDRFYPKYKEPLTPPKDAVMMKVVTYKGKDQVGRMIVMPMSELNKRGDRRR